MICEDIPATHSTSLVRGISRRARLQSRIASAKRAFTTRNVDLAQATRLVRSGHVPMAGDVILARVTGLGQHRRIENIHGRRGDLYLGDEIIVAYGNRYAPDQFEAYVPADLEPCQLVAGGGVAAAVAGKHASKKNATNIDIIGLLMNEASKPINLADFAGAAPAEAPGVTAGTARPPLVIAVVGSSMNAGKTTTVAGIVHGLSKAGFRVGAAKITGTGSGCDLWCMHDAGAAVAIDFTDAGYASTFLVEPAQLSQITRNLLARLDAENVDVAIIEIADGLLHHETAVLVEMGHAEGWFDGFVFAAADAMGAAFGCSWLNDRQITPLAISGVVSASPLASREAHSATGVSIATLAELRDPVSVSRIAFSAHRPALAAMARV